MKIIKTRGSQEKPKEEIKKMRKRRKRPFRVKYFYIPDKTARDKAFKFLADHLIENIHPLKKEKIKKRMKGLILKNKWVGQIVFDLKTGESEWKMKRSQNIKDYQEKLLKGEHIRKLRREWSKDFKRLAHNFARKNKQFRKNERKEKNKIKRMK